jgi:putative transposase
MPRPLRIEFPGACYHVINRGNYRRNLFEGGGAEAFERVLEEAAQRFRWRVHAYVIMRKHFTWPWKRRRRIWWRENIGF